MEVYYNHIVVVVVGYIGCIEDFGDWVDLEDIVDKEVVGVVGRLVDLGIVLVVVVDIFEEHLD